MAKRGLGVGDRGTGCAAIRIAHSRPFPALSPLFLKSEYVNLLQKHFLESALDAIPENHQTLNANDAYQNMVPEPPLDSYVRPACLALFPASCRVMSVGLVACWCAAVWRCGGRLYATASDWSPL